VRVHKVVFVIHLSRQEVEESGLIRFSIEDAFCAFVSSLFLLGLLVHLVVSVEEPKSEDNKADEEVNDLEGDVTLHFHVLPFGALGSQSFRGLNRLNDNGFAEDRGSKDFDCWSRSLLKGGSSNSNRGISVFPSNFTYRSNSCLEFPVVHWFIVRIKGLAGYFNFTGSSVELDINFAEIVGLLFGRNIFPELVKTFLVAKVRKNVLKFLVDHQILKFALVGGNSFGHSLLDDAVNLCFHSKLQVSNYLILDRSCVKFVGEDLSLSSCLRSDLSRKEKCECSSFNVHLNEIINYKY